MVVLDVQTDSRSTFSLSQVFVVWPDAPSHFSTAKTPLLEGVAHLTGTPQEHGQSLSSLAVVVLPSRSLAPAQKSATSTMSYRSLLVEGTRQWQALANRARSTSNNRFLPCPCPGLNGGAAASSTLNDVESPKTGLTCSPRDLRGRAAPYNKGWTTPSMSERVRDRKFLARLNKRRAVAS